MSTTYTTTLIRKKNVIFFLSFLFTIELFVSFLIFPNNYYREMTSPTILTGDAAFYDSAARSLARGEGYSINKNPTYAYQPGYPFLISLLYRVGGINYKPVVILQYIMLSGSFLIIIFLANELYNKPMITFFIAGCFMLNHVYLRIVGNYYSENLAIFLITVILYLLFIAQKHDSSILYISLGSLFGFLTLTRPIFEIFPFLALIISLLLARKMKRALRGIAIIFLLFLIIITPYMIRNWIIFELPQINAISGFLFYLGTNVTHDGICQDWGTVKKELKLDKYEDINLIPKEEVSQVNRFLINEGFKNILNNPLQFIVIYFKNMLRLFGWPDFPDGFSKMRGIHFYFLLHFSLLILFVSGFVKFVSNRDILKSTNLCFLIGYLLVFYYIILCPLFTGNSRFGLVIMPIIYLLFPYSLSRIFKEYSPPR